MPPCGCYNFAVFLDCPWRWKLAAFSGDAGRSTSRYHAVGAYLWPIPIEGLYLVGDKAADRITYVQVVDPDGEAVPLSLNETRNRSKFQDASLAEGHQNQMGATKVLNASQYRDTVSSSRSLVIFDVAKFRPKKT
jgi:hypothetical protein